MELITKIKSNKGIANWNEICDHDMKSLYDGSGNWNEISMQVPQEMKSVMKVATQMKFTMQSTS